MRLGGLREDPGSLGIRRGKDLDLLSIGLCRPDDSRYERLAGKRRLLLGEGCLGVDHLLLCEG